MKNPFVVSTAAARSALGTRHDVARRAPMSDLRVSASSVPEDADVCFTGVMEAIEGPALVVEGTVATSWVGECCRCLGPASGDVTVPVREVFEPEPTEGETYRLDGESVDLEPMVRETVMLELPEAPVCSPSCEGLCPVCGTNRNERACQCEAEPKDLRWAALDALRDEG